MTKKFAALIFALVLLLTACTKVPEKTVTGDVKEKTSMPEVVSEDVVSGCRCICWWYPFFWHCS